MFDRIAGVYDLMNTAMTAGMHHRWRERAADRAELGPGDAALDVCCGTGDLAFELARRVGSSGRGGRLRLLGADARAGAGEGADGRGDGGSQVRVRVGRRARASLRRRARSTPSRSASGSATSRTSERGLARDDARAEAGRPAGDPRDHPAPAPAALDLLLAVVRPAWCRCSARSPATATPTATCPSRCERFPPPAELAAIMDRRRARADPLPDPRRRDHRDPLRRQREPRRR